ncbi:hypothetical protein [Butyrivibrio sp. XPD2002]|uniref:hypothetical protein n=1 Tax=Butyrivibrio sp. XPD2002 TaxID=1280665 RepID=UPI0003FF9CE2|nr:hypothetical protein [Butyrivibrio sp. XPD2002]
MKKIMALLLAGALMISTLKISAVAAVRPPRPDYIPSAEAASYYAGYFEGEVDAKDKHIADLNRDVTELSGMVRELYKKLDEKTKVEVTVKYKKGSDSKPKVTVKSVGSSSGGGGNNTPQPTYVNTVLNAPGLDKVCPVGQGGKLIINGVKTRATFVMSETTSGKVASAKILAAGIGGTVKNVVETYAPGVRFSKAQVNFNVYCAKNGDIYKVYQMGPNGTWQEVQVDEVREGHVICTVYKAGTFAFIKMN